MVEYFELTEKFRSSRAVFLKRITQLDQGISVVSNIVSNTSYCVNVFEGQICDLHMDVSHNLKVLCLYFQLNHAGVQNCCSGFRRRWQKRADRSIRPGYFRGKIRPDNRRFIPKTS